MYFRIVLPGLVDKVTSDCEIDKALSMNISLCDHGSAKSQCDIMLYALKNGGVSTLKARQILGIMHPGGRVMELRGLGYVIHRSWISEKDISGVEHRVAYYQLVFEPQKLRAA